MYRVFLADDEPWVILGLKNLIDWGKEGFVICGEATDGIKAWERICHLKPDLILSDIQMPGLTGMQLIEKVREAEIDAEVVVVSGYSEFEYARTAMKFGCADYLLKPVYEDVLLTCLEQVKKRRAQYLGDNAGGGEEASQALADEKSYLNEKRVAQELLCYIQKHYAQVNQTMLADVFCLSPSAVSQIIKKYTGRTYSEQLLDVRIQKAQELLRTTNESIESIAEKVGYHDYFYFVKVFKKAAGISPSVFRRQL